MEAFLEKIDFRIAVKTSIAAALALFFDVAITQAFDRPDSMISGLWSVVSAIVVVQAYVGGTYQAAWVRFLGTCLGTIFAGIAITFLGSSIATLSLTIFFTVTVCSFIGLKESVRIASMTVAVIIVLWGMSPNIGPWAFGFYRFIDSCVGILVAVVVVHTFWPMTATRVVRLNMAEILERLNTLFSGVTDMEGASFPSLILKESIVDYLNETRNDLDEARIEIRTRSSLEEWFLLLGYLERAYENIEEIEEVEMKRLKTLFSPDLAHEITLCIKTMQAMMAALAKGLKEKKSVTLTTEEAIARLQEAITHFREAKGIRGHPLADVERFFVLFHALRGLSIQLTHIANRLNTFY